MITPMHQTTDVDDLLTQQLCRGERDLLRQAVEAELQTFFEDQRDRWLSDNRRVGALNDYRQERKI